MIRLLGILLFLSFGSLAWCVQAKDTVNWQNPDMGFLEQLFLKELNQYRQGLGLNPLQSDPKLNLAANDQAQFMAKAAKVTHDQNIAGHRNPSERVKVVGGLFSIVGENCLSTPVMRSVLDKTGDLYPVYTYGEVAKGMFRQWKLSPPHHANMIRGAYYFSGLGICYVPSSNSIYAAQVFGSKPYVSPFQLDEVSNDYGIGGDGNGCDFGEYDNIVGIFSKYLVIKGDSIFQYYRDLDVFKKIFPGPRDGIAVDIVFATQMDSTGSHNFHPSPIRDGYLLPPVYRDTLLKRNRYKDSFYAFVGLVPKGIRDDNNGLQFNTLIIRNGRCCRYSFPVDVFEDWVSPFEIEPMFIPAQGKITSGEHKGSFAIRVPFETGSVKIQKGKESFIPKRFQAILPFIDSVHIKAFSSIEGTEEQNLKLQNARVDAIRNKLSSIGISTQKVSSVAKENWDLYYKQIDSKELRIYKRLTKEQVREKLKDSTFYKMFAPLLDDQREAIVRFYYKVKYTNESEPGVLPFAMQQAIFQKDSAQAQIIQTRMFQDAKAGKIDCADFFSVRIPCEPKFSKVISNFTAGLVLWQHEFIDSTKYLGKAIGFSRRHHEMVLNYIQYRANFVYFLQNGPNLNALQGELQKLSNMLDEEKMLKLKWNFFLVGAELNSNAGDGAFWIKSLKNLIELFPKLFNEEYKAQLFAGFLNRHYQFEWAVDILKPIYKSGKYSDDLLLLLFSNLSLTRYGFSDDEYYAIAKELVSRNPKYFFRWVDRNWQLLRDDRMRLIYSGFMRRDLPFPFASREWTWK